MTIPTWVTKTASFVLLGAIVVAGFLYKPTTTTVAYTHQVHITGVPIPIRTAFATTSAEQARGLSGIPFLEIDQGMLFLFDSAFVPKFWMKDMQFPIDIIWIGADKHIVDITLGVEQGSYPKTFSPSVPAQYVLEVYAGFVQTHLIQIGAEVSF